MSDRLTDAELREIDVAAPVAPPTVAEVHAMVAEVLEHRAARTLTDEERKWVDLWRGSSAARELLAIIDRITEGDDDE